MLIDRRDLLSRTALAVVAGMAVGMAPALADALSEDEATAHVRSTIDEIVALVDSPGDSASKAPRLLAIMERRAAMPQIARFAAGVAWRGMTEDQQTRFVAAFGTFVSRVYASRFQEYAGGGNAGEAVKMGRVIDAGRKGMLVKTSIIRTGEAPVEVEWLVTDRPGRVVIADFVIEGVSMLVTEREEIGGMLEALGGNVEKLIADLAT
ncbi:MAG: phospholipid-binding protein MlaC [Paracoccaceae bacterium]